MNTKFITNFFNWRIYCLPFKLDKIFRSSEFDVEEEFMTLTRNTRDDRDAGI